MAKAANRGIGDLIGDAQALEGVHLEEFGFDLYGMQTLLDIRRELRRPGRDPRPQFRVPKFAEGVASIEDLKDGTETEGIVTNITDFGAFIDIGIHQDGLVHLSEMTNRYVRDPREVVQLGAIVKVKVIKVDRQSGRISLSMKALQTEPQSQRHRGERHGHRDERTREGHAAQSDRPREVAASAEDQGVQHPQRTHQPHQRREQRDSDQERRPRRQDRGRRDDRRGDGFEGGPREGRRSQRGRQPQRAQAKPTGMPSAMKHSDSESGVNTLLADQLAMLKEQLDE